MEEMRGKGRTKEEGENIYEEIKTAPDSHIKDLKDNSQDESDSLLHGISAGRRKTIRLYAQADWDFAQQFQNQLHVDEKKTVNRSRSVKTKCHDTSETLSSNTRRRSKS